MSKSKSRAARGESLGNLSPKTRTSEFHNLFQSYKDSDKKIKNMRKRLRNQSDFDHQCKRYFEFKMKTNNHDSKGICEKNLKLI